MPLSIRSVLAAVGFLALGATSTLALDAAARPGGPGAQSGHHGPKMPGAGLARAMGEIDLTDAQRDALEAIREDVKAEVRAKRAEKMSERGDLVESFTSGEVSREQIHAAIDAHAAERLAMAHAVTDRVLDVYETLTPDQKADVAEVIAERMERHSERMDRRDRGDGDGPPRRR